MAIRSGCEQDRRVGQRIAVDDEEVGALADLDRAEVVEPERLGRPPGRGPDRGGGTEPGLRPAGRSSLALAPGGPLS